MKIMVGIIPGGRGGSKYSAIGEIDVNTIDPQEGDWYEVFSGANVLPNDSDQVDTIVKMMADEGCIVACWDVYGEGVVVYAPAGASLDKMKLAAYEKYNGED